LSHLLRGPHPYSAAPTAAPRDLGAHSIIAGRPVLQTVDRIPLPL